MKTQSISRREFLKTSATAALAATTPGNLFAAGEYGGNRIPFGLQLYSVRNECAKDLDGTVKAVAKMGYKAVEFAGYYGRDAKADRKSVVEGKRGEIGGRRDSRERKRCNGHEVKR